MSRPQTPLDFRWFPDAIRVWAVVVLLPRDRRRLLNRLCGGKVKIQRKTMLFKMPDGKMVRQGPWEVYISLGQPSRWALILLSRWLRQCQDQVLISGLEIAVDTITSSHEASEAWFEWLINRLAFRYKSPKHEVFKYRNVIYYHQRRRGVTSCLAVYADKPSKPTVQAGNPQSCLHVELRLAGRTLRRKGVHTIEDVLNMDAKVKTIFDGRVQLLEIPEGTGMTRLGQCLHRVPLWNRSPHLKRFQRGSRTLVMDLYKRKAGAYVRLSNLETVMDRQGTVDRSANPIFSLQKLIDLAQRDFNIRRVLQPVKPPWANSKPQWLTLPTAKAPRVNGQGAGWKLRQLEAKIKQSSKY